MGIAALRAASESFAQRAAPDPVNVASYKSPSGEYMCEVDPTDLYGKGPADYRIVKGGVEIWKGRKQFTLYQAAITDDGKVLGYGYTEGLEAGRDEGDFKVTIFDADGTVRLEESVPRKGSRFLHDVPQPVALGIEVSKAEDRFTVRVRDPDMNKQSEQAWDYRISKAKSLGRKDQPQKPYDNVHDRKELAPSFNLADLPTIALESAGMIELKTQAQEITQVKNVVDFRFDGVGRIGFLRNEDNSEFGFLLLESDGSLKRQTRLDIPKVLTAGGQPRVAWIQTNRWIVVASESGIEGKAQAWWIDADTEKIAKIPGFDSHAVEQIAGDGAGGFVVLAKVRLRYSSAEELARFDSSGKALWRKRQDGYRGTPDELLSTEDLVVTADGMIAVLSNVRKGVQYFDLNGKFKSSHDLKNANYPTAIRRDTGGGFVIRDFGGKPEIIRIDASMKVHSGFAPRYSDGRAFDVTRGFDVSPDGRVWVSDGESIARLSDKGAVDLVLGAAPDAEALTEIASVTVNNQGEILAADTRTASVHIFDTNGALLRICKPAVGDFKSKLISAKIACAPNGDIYLSDSLNHDGLLQFDSQGKRIGLRKFGIDSIHEQLFPRPRGDFLMLGYNDAFLVKNDGTISRKISRRADRKWLEHAVDAAVAADGSFAIESSPGWYQQEPWPVTIYAADGEPRGMMVQPAGCRNLAFTGSLLLTRNDTHLVAANDLGKGIWKHALAGQWKDSEILAPLGGREIWVVDSKRKQIQRLRLPLN